MSRIIRTAVVIATMLAIGGCKLAIMVSSHGSVLSGSGTRDCAGPDYCEFIVTDLDFSETFTAVPRPGFDFVKWQDGNGFICADSTDPVCVVQMPDTTIGAVIVALFSTGSLRPVFSDPGGVDTDGDGMINDVDSDDDNDFVLDAFDNCPLDGPDIDGFGCPVPTQDDTLRINDKVWLQPELLALASWYDASDACSQPAGLCSGKIRDIDVTGWTWAEGDEVTALLNGFMGTALGSVPDEFVEPGAYELSPNIFDFFRSYETCCTSSQIYGWIREEANIVEGYLYGVDCNDLSDDRCLGVRVGTSGETAKTESLERAGVWLYKSVP